MAGLISDLVDVLNEQTQCYNDLILLSEQKKDAIIKNDINAVQSVNGSESTAIGKSQRIEKKRMELVKDIAEVLNTKEEELTLRKLLGLIEGQPEYDSLQKAREDIRKVVHELKELNERNKVLLNNSLEYIDFSLNVMRSSMDSSLSTYDSKGQEVDNRRNLFDAKQ